MSRAIPDGNGYARHLAGWHRDRALPAGHDPMLRVARTTPLPPTGDLPLMKQVPVYDQGGEGSCTANMGCAQVRYLWAKHGNAAGFAPSRQNLYKATRTVEGTPLTEDSGAQIRDVMVALRRFGVCNELLDPYYDTAHSYSAAITSVQAADALQHQALFYYRCDGVTTIKQSILQGYPVGFGFTCFESLMSMDTARTGDVPYPEAGEKSVGGHANLVIGFDDNHVIAGEKGAFISRNSWSSAWGKAGDLAIPYRYFLDGLASDAWTLRVQEIP